MALEGTLRDFSLADILQLISLQKKVGLLTLRSPDDTVTLGFVEGKLVSAESSARRMDTRLGTVLVKTHRLSPEGLKRALEIQGQTLQRLGFILLKNGFCTNDDLHDGLDIQIKKIVYGLFRWTDGDYIFDQQDKIDYDHDSVTPIGIESLLMDGARMTDEWPIIEKVVRSVDLVYQKVHVGQPVVSADQDEDVDEMGDSTMRKRAKDQKAGPIRISPAEWAVYELVDGRRSVAEINERTFLSEFDGCKSIYDLVTRGLVEEIKREKSVPVEETTTMAIPTQGRHRSPVLGVALAAGVAALGYFAFGMQSLNPLNLLTVPARSVDIIDNLNKSVSLLRLRRLTEAVDTYYLTSGKYPQSLDVLVNSDLVSQPELLDPWGRRYRYILTLQLEKYYLVGFDQSGKTDTDLFFSNNFKGGVSASPGSKLKLNKDVVVLE
ncbi:MAG: DUF4388 domain-containing protein [Thermoanaerobaculia bacterium]